jgi:UDP-N-acetylmuramyl tripeptide synthase
MLVCTSHATQQRVQAPLGRYQTICTGGAQNFHIIIDRARTLPEVDTLLTTVREMPGAQRIILVIGCDGDVDDDLRAQRKYIGEIAHHRADVVVFTNASYRTEDPEKIIQDMVDGLPKYLFEDWDWTKENLMVDAGRISPVRPCGKCCDASAQQSGHRMTHVIAF